MTTELTVALPRYHAAQRRVLEHPSKRKVLFWARQTGKSTFGESETVEHLLRGETGAVFCVTRPYVSDFYHAVISALPPEVVTQQSRSTPMEIRTSMGGHVIFWPVQANPQAGRGGTNDFVIYEEAGLIEGLKKHFYGVIEATLGAKDGVAYFQGNAKPRGDFNDLFHLGQVGKFGWWSDRIESRDNPHGIPVAKLEELREFYEQEEILPLYDMEYRAIPMLDAGSPWPQYADCLAPMSDDDPIAWGWDLAQAQDHTIGIALDRQMRVCRYVDTHDHGHGDWPDIEDLIWMHSGKVLSILDETGVGASPVQHLQRKAEEAGYVNRDGKTNYRGFKFTPGPNGGKQAAYRGVKAEFRRGVIRVPDGLITGALQSAENKVKDTQDGPVVMIDVPHGIQKDRVDALALAIMAYHEAAHELPTVLDYERPSADRLAELGRAEAERRAKFLEEERERRERKA